MSKRGYFGQPTGVVFTGIPVAARRSKKDQICVSSSSRVNIPMVTETKWPSKWARNL
jgi:hypothetical protein